MREISIGRRAVPLCLVALAWVFPACSSVPDPGETPPTPTGTTTGTTPPPPPPPDASVDAAPKCGAAGPKCAEGAACAAPADCASGNCASGTCQPASCTNGVQDGTETGTDCGGACKKCDGEPCTSNADCLSTTCAPDKTCAPPGTKTCGVGLPNKCQNGEPCVADRDCATDYCRALACGDPPATVHQDGRRDGGETGVDCGGTALPEKPCRAGERCVNNDDCQSKCEAGYCTPPNATDGKKNNGETDVDCGGPNAPKCGVGKVCAVKGDCGFDVCTAGVCGLATSTDGIKNGGESDVDCGGTGQTYDGVVIPPAPRCEAAQVCAIDGDCYSSVCARGVCVEGPSCRPLHGGATCGSGEVGQAGARHDSCCKSLPVPGLTMVHQGVTKQVYVDKYEITAGRIRAWVTDLKAQFAGQPDVRAWVEARILTDPLVAAQLNATSRQYLPSRHNGQPFVFPSCANHPNYPNCTQDIGIDSQLGPLSYYRGFSTGGTSGCYMGAGGYGHRTYWFDDALSVAFGEVPRPGMKDLLDQKSMNCAPPPLFAAFCAWDGGYMITQQAMAEAYGQYTWPWGDTPIPQDAEAAWTNYNAGTSGFGAAKNPRYLWPVVGYNTFANDLSPIIAAPGRFPTDLSIVKPFAGSDESWMDLGGNMIEWSANTAGAGTYHGWTGSSFEGHVYPRSWGGGINILDKYGKGGARCMRLR
ncbi:MAG TPA: hypothetical protein PLR99_11690 [Polyangiaceae bacterium]|nr:hypothetical protein [Polyangiaceae bacterium]